jgi:shikimate dehydrogenase
MSMTPEPDRYAVIGHPIAHSRSPWIHAQFAQQTGQHLRYEAIDVAPGELRQRLREFFARGGRGLNVTVPHKQAVLEHIDDSSASERALPARSTPSCAKPTAGCAVTTPMASVSYAI